MPVQTDLFMDNEKRLKLEKIDEALDQIRRRFGYKSIQRAIMYTDRNLSRINPCEDHTVHPHGYF